MDKSDYPTCKTCDFWEGKDTVTNPDDPDTYEPMAFDFEVRLCGHPELTLFERPMDAYGFGVCDGSGFRAVFMTAENFGCIRHSAIPLWWRPWPNFPGFDISTPTKDNP